MLNWIMDMWCVDLKKTFEWIMDANDMWYVDRTYVHMEQIPN